MSKRSIVQEVPAAKVLEETPEQRFGKVVGAHGAAHSGEPCTEVHLLIPVVDGFGVALRLKSARALDELVGVLLAHRKDVFG